MIFSRVMRFLLSTATVFLLMVSFSYAGIEYFVSASLGDDNNDGRSMSSPWATLARVNEARFVAGDTVYFKAGDTFAGQLLVDESGMAGQPIHFTAYGEGDTPIIDGSAGSGGSELAAILVINQDHIEISHLTIRNFRKQTKANVADMDAYGILVKNTGKRILSGFNFHHLTVEEIYPIKARASFNNTSVTGIRFETKPAKNKRQAVNTRDIYIHDNFIRHTARFGIALRHRPSRVDGVKNTELDYDVNVRIINNRCEDIGGSCVLMNGTWQGLLEGNTFIRSGAMVEPSLSVNRGSGAWFFRSKHIVAQYNSAYGSRGHNDSAGMHVDYANENILVQYNFSHDNEGYGTEILGKNKNIIWRFNISAGDGTRRTNVERPEGGKSKFPGKTIFVSDFSVPKRIQSREIFIYNNSYLITSGSDPQVEFNGEQVQLYNNLFVVEAGARLAKKLNISWLQGESLDMRGNAFVGNISPSFIRFDSQPFVTQLTFNGEPADASSYAVDVDWLKLSTAFTPIQHPLFPAAGKGIFSHVSAVPTVDFFGNPLASMPSLVGAGYQSANAK